MRLERADQLAAQLVQQNGLVAVPPFAGFVVRDDRDPPSQVRAAVLISHFDGSDCELTVIGRLCASRGVLRALFGYIFDACAATRVSARAAISNRKAIGDMLRLGFRVEGRKRQALAGEDLALLGMLKDECIVRRRRPASSPATPFPP